MGIIKTEGGLVQGKRGDVYTYLGIPYAAAPIGEYRWRPPRPAPSWRGIRDAHAFGPDCMQPAEYPEMRGAGMSEDCLTVNVWSPATRPDEKLPVMVWIYGGSYIYGSGSLPSYDGTALARRGVVVVNLNYRMGLFGFMAHPELSAESPHGSSGNYALLDQIAALEWVQRNIGAFGGDPGKVTVFGQSAGAHAISALIASPLADGLFQQAILQSVVGVMRPMPTLKQAEEYGNSFGSSIKDLRRLPAAEIVKLLMNDPPPQTLLTRTKVLNIVTDGYIVRDSDFKPFGGGQLPRIRILAGTVSNEGGGSSRSNSLVKTTQQWHDYLNHNFPGMEVRANKVFGVENDSQVPQALTDLYSDTQFLFSTREVLTAANSARAPAYRYVFSRHRNDGFAAPIHGDELQFTFDNLTAPRRGRLQPFDSTDQKVAGMMADAWVRFAKTGNPGGSDLPPWPMYESSSELYMDFDNSPYVGNGYDSRRLDTVRDYYWSRWH